MTAKKSSNRVGKTRTDVAPPLFVQPMGKISNRQFLKRLKEFGCEVVKTSGDDTIVRVQGVPVLVRSEHCHRGNGVDTIRECLGLLDIDWNTFMGADLVSAWERVNHKIAYTLYQTEVPPPEILEALWDEALIEDRDRTRARRQAEREAQWALEREQQKATREATVEQAKEKILALVEEDPHEYTDDKQTRTRRINEVFDYMVRVNEPVSTARCAQDLGMTRQQVSSPLIRLTDIGLLERVKAGVYRIKPDYVEQTTTRLNVQVGEHPLQVTNGPALDPVRPVQPTAALVAPVPPPAVPVASLAPTGHEDATINEILDLIAPNGFKAKHLPLIDAFKSTTLALMREIGGQ